MTYNVLGMQADSAVVDEHAGWAARIDQLRPDVLVVQEVQSDDVSALRDRPMTDYVLAAYRPWQCDLKPSPEGVAILVHSELSFVGGGGTHLGTSCSDPTMRRVLVWADLEVGGATWRIYGTHLTAGDGPAAASRLAQIRELRATVAAHDPAGEGRWLVTGDLNVTPDGADYSAALEGSPGELAPGRLVDTAAEGTPASDPVACPGYAEDHAAGMALLLAEPQRARDCAYTGGWPKDGNWLACDLLSFCVSWEQRRDLSVRIRIDYVLRAEEGPAEVLATHVPNRADADWASPGAEWFRLSDHLPYVVDLTLG